MINSLIQRFYYIGRLILITVLIIFTSTAFTSCCKPFISQSESISFTTEDNKVIQDKTDCILKLLQNKEYDKILSDENLLSQQILKNKSSMQLIKKALPCLEKELGDLIQINPKMRVVEKQNQISVTGQSQSIKIIQPVKYTHGGDIMISLRFNKEKKSYFVHEMHWLSKNPKNVLFLKCFTPF